MKHFFVCLVLLTGFGQLNWLSAQGPPITADKPIMLSEGSFIFKTLTEVRWREDGVFANMPLMVHYIPTRNSLVAVHLPMTVLSFDAAPSSEVGLGDISLLGKYQFFRKDGTAKSLRMVAKTLQTFPTGERAGIEGISTGRYQSYVAAVLGYESIKYGISAEIGHHLVPKDDFDAIHAKLGFGLPLLKPTYPVKQINLYFEYNFGYQYENSGIEFMYAQGIQYAIKRLTLEIAGQIPIIQTTPGPRMKGSLLVGCRYII